MPQLRSLIESLRRYRRLALDQARHQLQADQQKEKRHRQCDVIGAGTENFVDERIHSRQTIG